MKRITHDQVLLALVVRRDVAVKETTFLTEGDLNLQAGFITYPAGGVIPRHVHHPIERRIVGTPEAILVRQGRCELQVYDDNRNLVATCELERGDLVMLFAGGHGFEVLEDTILLEIKQGPYPGADEKERF